MLVAMVLGKLQKLPIIVETNDNPLRDRFSLTFTILYSK